MWDSGGKLLVTSRKSGNSIDPAQDIFLSSGSGSSLHKTLFRSFHVEIDDKWASAEKAYIKWECQDD